MATTTPNFGWSVPTSTDLVKDGATAIETLGDSIDASLVDLKGGTTGQALVKNSNTDMDFVWSSIDPLTILDAKGDLISATAADTPARLGVGTNGQILTADSTQATGLKWASPAGGGKVLQVVQATYSTSTTVASTTYADTGLTATITPSSATSKVLVIANIATQAEGFSSATNVGLGVRLVRASTTIFTQDPIRQSTLLYAQMVSGSNGLIDRKVTAITYLDSPSTTSATAYKIQGASETATGTNQAVFQASSAVSTITLLEIGA